MTFKGALGILGGAASAAAIIAVAFALRSGTKAEWNGEGAFAEHVKACCDRVDKIEAGVTAHHQEAEGWKARILANEDKDAWQDRRLDAIQETLEDLRQTIGRIEGTQAEILRRLPAPAGSKRSDKGGHGAVAERLSP